MGARGTFGASWLAPTWSLAVEEQFYSVLPLLIWLLPAKVLRRTLIVAICAAPLLRAPFSEIIRQVEMPMRADSLLLGAVVALSVRNVRFLDRLRSSPRAFGATFLVLLAGAAVMCERPAWFGVFVQTWLAALYSMLLLTPFASVDSLVSRVLRARVLRFFGSISYSLYLIHQIVLGVLHGIVYRREPRIEDSWGACVNGVAFVISVTLSYATFTWIEKQFVARGHRYRYVQTKIGAEAEHPTAKGI
jgi:peptidoglycan/LPS O-acetylase OafA/YrhL